MSNISGKELGALLFAIHEHESASGDIVYYEEDLLKVLKAIEWVQGQPPAVRERATSADLVVSHYLQACRRANAASVEAPVSQEAFKADLKHLVEDLKLFETSSPPNTQNPNRSPSYEFIPKEEPAPPAPVFQPPPMPPAPPAMPPPMVASSPVAPQPH
jgi:hypothetical protein